MSLAIRVLNMGKRGIVIGFAEPSLLSRLPMFFLLADRIEVSGLRLFSTLLRYANTKEIYIHRFIRWVRWIE